MGYAVVCRGARLFGLVLPPFTLSVGGVMIVKSYSVTPEAHHAELLLCEALCGTVVVEGIEVCQPFVAVHPLLRANAWGYSVAARVFRPEDKMKVIIEHIINSMSR